MPAGSASSIRACRASSGCCCSFTCSGTHTGPGPGDAGKRREDTAGRLKQLGISSNT
jgi:hypothetical protein